jgi:ferric-dicitrate binding protein FerR (iron transport regulator)
VNAPRYAAAAAKLLAKHAPRVPEQLAERERSVATIERAVRTRSRRRALALAGAGVAVAAAAVLVLIAWPRQQVTSPVKVSISVAALGQGAAVRASGTSQPISSGAKLYAGQHLETPTDGGASLRLSTGTEMTLAGSTSFRVESQGENEHFALERGELVAHVAKLSAGGRFVVDTPDARIEVRGTRFRLRVLGVAESCGRGVRTRLSVTEGVVEARMAGGEVQSIAAGENWPSDCHPVAVAPSPAPPSSAAGVEAAPSSQAARAPVPEAGDRPASSPGGSPSALEVEPSSRLAAQNDLFARGVALRREGDAAGALRAFNELIRRFPRSPLAENAMVERLRLLVARRDGSGADEAERYLARYPRGFAVGEARRALEGK